MATRALAFSSFPMLGGRAQPTMSRGHEPYDAKADLWSAEVSDFGVRMDSRVALKVEVGAILFELLMGRQQLFGLWYQSARGHTWLAGRRFREPIPCSFWSRAYRTAQSTSQAQRKEAIQSAPRQTSRRARSCLSRACSSHQKACYVLGVLGRHPCHFPVARPEVPSSAPRQPGTAALQPGRHGHGCADESQLLICIEAFMQHPDASGRIKHEVQLGLGEARVNQMEA